MSYVNPFIGPLIGAGHGFINAATKRHGKIQTTDRLGRKATYEAPPMIQEAMDKIRRGDKDNLITDEMLTAREQQLKNIRRIQREIRRNNKIY